MRRAVLLSGPRRVGKTTILRQIAVDLVERGEDPKSVLYLSLDHPLLKLVSLRDILALYHETLYREGQGVTLLLDEIQYSSGWETEVKLLVDHQPHYRIIATGSASVVHRERLAERRRRTLGNGSGAYPVLLRVCPYTRGTGPECP